VVVCVTAALRPRICRSFPADNLINLGGATGLAAALAILIGAFGQARANDLPIPKPRQPEKGFYGSYATGGYWPQPIHYEDNRLGPLLPIKGTVLMNPGFSTDRAVGYDFGALRSELSWVYRQAAPLSSTWTVGPFRPASSTSTSPVSGNSLFASLYWDVPVHPRLVPYVGGGLGYSVLRTNPTTLSLGRFSQTINGSSARLMAFQAKAGLAYRASPRSDVFVEGVYQGTPARHQENLQRSALISWGFRLGLRYRFTR